MKQNKIMCVIGFDERLQNEGFQELMDVVKKGKEITCMGNDQYLVEKEVCARLQTTHHIVEEITA